MIVSQRIAGLFKEYGFISLDSLYDWLVTKRLPSTTDILKILSKNPRHYARNVDLNKIDPKWIYDEEQGKWIYDPCFGKQTECVGDIGSNTMGTAYDTVWVCRYNLSEDGTVTEISFYCKAVSGTIDVKTVIYDDSATDPNNRKGISDEVAGIDTTFAWEAFPANISLIAGDQHLGWNASADGNAKYDSGETDQFSREPSPYSSYPNFPDPFGTPNAQLARAASIFATYTTEEVKPVGSIVSQVVALVRAGVIG